MFRRYQLFIRGISTNWPGALGVVFVTSAFILLIFMELLRLIGIVTNSYVGLLTYMILPAIFVIGLLLIPLSWLKYRKDTGLTTEELLEQRFNTTLTAPKLAGSDLAGLIALLTTLNVLFLGIGGSRMLHFMDGPVFCGTACHKVMGPEWAAYQNSPHAHVNCVECHVGEGVKGLIDSKLNGLWQIVSATFDLYERPIPTPVHNLRPARETCEKCHWPDKFYGDRIKVFSHHRFDEESTPIYTTLALKVGSGEGSGRGEIHWHVAEQNEVRYASIDDHREKISWVEVRQPGGEYKRFTNRVFQVDPMAQEHIRVLDCVDCHNRATHAYEDPERAVDQRIADGLMDRSLPFLKREALAALTGNYANSDAAVSGIDNNLRGFYARHFREGVADNQESISKAVEILQTVHSRNVHHEMRVDWNSYPDHRGHRAGGGCFRCHNDGLVDPEGKAISSDCTLCHSILSYDSEEPFKFLQPVEGSDRDLEMHRYLQAEFLRSRLKS